MSHTDLSDLAVPGTRISVRVTPKASRNVVLREADQIRVYVTVVPEGGKANTAVTKLLAKALIVRYSAVSTTAVTTAVPLEPPWQSGAHRPDGAWIGHIVHPYTSPQLRNAIQAFRSLTKAKEAPTEHRAQAPIDSWVWCARLATIQQCIQLLAV